MPPLGEAGTVSQLAEDLALLLGCPVEVSYLKNTLEVVVVARLEPGREVRVSLPVPLLALGLSGDPYTALKYDLLKQLRHQMSQEPAEG